MSSYIYFYGKLKTTEDEKNCQGLSGKVVNLCAFSSNSDIYDAFHDNCNISHCHNGTDYTVITSNDIDKVKTDIKCSIQKTEARIHEYERYASQNCEYIMEILSAKEYLETLYQTLHHIEFIGFMVEDSANGLNDFTQILANIS